MAILDLLTLKLIEPDLAIETPTTGVGRVFHTQLQSMLGRSGLLQLYWGRHCDDRGLVGLIFVWEDEATRSAFQYSGLDFWILNKYLETPMSLLIIRNMDPSQLLDLNGKFLLIRTQVRSTEDKDFDMVWNRCRQIFLADTDVKSLQGSLCRLDAADEIQRDISSLHRSKEEELHFVELAHAFVGVASNKAHCQRVSSLNIAVIDKTIELKHFAPYSPVAPHGVVTPTRISDVFVRDLRLLTVPQPQTISEVDIVGPRGLWRSPKDSYWIGDSRCFNYTGSLVNAEPRAPQILSLPSHKDSYFETLSFVFKHGFQDPIGTKTDLFDAFRAYRKCLHLQRQCNSVYLIIHPSDPRFFELFIEWSNSSDSANFHASQLAKDSLLKLGPYFATAGPPSPSPGVAFHPLLSCPNAEVIDFILAPSASAAEKRAFMLFFEDMFEIMEGPTETCLGVRDPLSVCPEGWVNTSELTHSAEGIGASDDPASGSIYRILLYWDGHAEEAEWVREFAQSPYIYGVPSQMIALCVDRVVAKRVQFVKDELHLLRDENEESESDEDMGF